MPRLPRLHEAPPPAAFDRLALASNIAVLIDMLDQFDGQDDYDGEEDDCCPACDDQIRGGSFQGGGAYPGDDADDESSIGWTDQGGFGDLPLAQADLEGDSSDFEMSGDEHERNGDEEDEDADPEPSASLPATPAGGLLGGGILEDGNPALVALTGAKLIPRDRTSQVVS